MKQSKTDDRGNPLATCTECGREWTSEQMHQNDGHTPCCDASDTDVRGPIRGYGYGEAS